MSKRYILNGSVEFSPENQRLSARDTPKMVVALNLPSSRCLELLVERRFSLVTQQEFYPYVWGSEGAAVPASALYQNISLLRKALKTFTDEGDKMIKTFPRRGFALSPEVDVQEIAERQEDTVMSSAPPVEELSVQQPEPDEVPFTLPSPVAKKSMVFSFSRSKWPFFFTAATLLVGMAYQLYLLGDPFPTNFFSSYVEKGRVSGCYIYTNAGTDDLTKIKSLLDDNRVDCGKTPYIYMSRFPYSTHISLLTCKHRFGDTSQPACIVYNFLGRAVE